MNKIKHRHSILVLATLLAVAYLRFYYGSKSLLLNGATNLLLVLILLGFGELLLISILSWVIHLIAYIKRQVNVVLLVPLGKTDREPNS